MAIAETVFAVALYWGIAVVFDTHLHLVTSLFVAPLLLFRSERSIAAGVAWFWRDRFDIENYESWPRAGKGVLLGITAVLSLVGLQPACACLACKPNWLGAASIRRILRKDLHRAGLYGWDYDWGCG